MRDNCYLCNSIQMFFDKNQPPDILSQEWDKDNKPVIILTWHRDRDKTKTYSHTDKRFNRVRDLFCELWRAREAANTLITGEENAT